MLAALQAETIPCAEEYHAQRVGFIGHSRGGFAALCSGSKHDTVKAICTLAAISAVPQAVPEDARAWRENGVRYVANARTGQQLPMGVGLLDDALERKDSIEQSTRALTVPLLVIHGDQDEAVSVKAAHDLTNWAPNSELRILAGAGHTFGIVHPYQGSSEHFDSVIQLAGEFFQKHLLRTQP